MTKLFLVEPLLGSSFVSTLMRTFGKAPVHFDFREYCGTLFRLSSVLPWSKMAALRLIAYPTLQLVSDGTSTGIPLPVLSAVLLPSL